MVWNNDEILFSKKSFDVKAPYRKEDFMDSQFKLKMYYVLHYFSRNRITQSAPDQTIRRESGEITYYLDWLWHGS